MSDTIYVVYSKSNGEGDFKFQLLGAFRDAKSVPPWLIESDQYSISVISVELEQDRTVYFRELKYCECCSDSTVDIKDKIAFVVEVKHEDSKRSYYGLEHNLNNNTAPHNIPESDQIPSWHFDALFPTLRDAQNYAGILNGDQPIPSQEKSIESEQKRYIESELKFPRRIYMIKLPHSRETFANRVNFDRKKEEDEQAVKDKEKKTVSKQINTMRKDVNHTMIAVNRTFLLGITILALNIFILFSK